MMHPEGNRSPTAKADAGDSSRLAIVVSHPIQYYSPWFRHLSETTDLNIRAFYLWDFGVTETRDRQFEREIKWDVDLLSGYESEFVPNVAADPGTHHFNGLDNPSLAARLIDWRPDAVLLFGYNWKSNLLAIARCRLRRLPLILRGDSHLLGRPQPSAFKRLVMQVLLRQFAAMLYVGQANRSYYRAYGVPESRLFFAPHSVDAARFDPNDPRNAGASSRLRSELGLGNRRVLLFAGKFEAKKQPLALLEAYLRVANRDNALVFVGNGSEEDRLRSAAAARPDAVVRFLPFANQSNMPGIYAMADIVALPSRGGYETWGLVVNEAMHMRRPCIVSDVVGCQQDLVFPGKTGWVCSSDEPESLYRAVRDSLATPSEKLASMGSAAAEIASQYVYTKTTTGLLDALGSIQGVRT